MEKPKLVGIFDSQEFKDTCQEYVDFVDSDEYHEDRSDSYENAIFESALEMLYGEKVFDWINKRIDEHEEA
jgi:hypothetical protein